MFMMMTTTVFLVVTAGLLVGGSSEVMQQESVHSCCGSPTIQFDQRCDNSWTIENEPFAQSKGSKTACRHPCEKIEAGQMILDSCVDVNTTRLCTNEMKEVSETNIIHYGKLCSGSPGSHAAGSVGFLLLAVVIGRLMVG